MITQTLSASFENAQTLAKPKRLYFNLKGKVSLEQGTAAKTTTATQRLQRKFHTCFWLEWWAHLVCILLCNCVASILSIWWSLHIRLTYWKHASNLDAPVMCKTLHADETWICPHIYCHNLYIIVLKDNALGFLFNWGVTFSSLFSQYSSLLL